MKTCYRCNETKEIAEYYRHSRMADGHLNKCKSCCKKEAIAYREARIEYWRKHDRKRGNTDNHRARNRELYRKRVATEDGRANDWTLKAEWRKRNRDKRAAHIAVNNALRDGKLVKGSCVRCGTEDNIHAHHEDYSRQLDVIWLCLSCHGLRHQEINESKRSHASRQ